MTAPQAANPLLAPSPLAFQLPPFALIETTHFEPAFDAGMAEHRAEVAAVVTNPEPATVENTLEEMERSGRLLARTTAAFHTLVATDSTPRLREIEARYAPRLTEHYDAIQLDQELFRRIAAVHAAEQVRPSADPEARKLVARYHLDFVLAGAALGDGDRRILSDLNRRLSELATTFAQNLLQANESATIVIDDPAQLDGLTVDEIAAAAGAAAARDLPGKYAITLVSPSRQPLLAVLRNRDVRQRLFEASLSRANSGTHDNRPVLSEIAQLRARRARLLGFASHADATVADQTIGSTAAMDAFLGQLIEPAMANADAEAQLLRQAAAEDGVELAAWDWVYYAEIVRRDRFDVDTASLREYFELERVLTEGVFAAARQLYGIEMVPRHDLTGYHPDVRIWEVKNADGSSIGLFLGDYFARESKRGGAWMTNFVDQSFLLDSSPVVVNVLNITAPSAGQPALLGLDEVRTLFHEFGHALHGLFSRVRYPRLSGTAVPRDFVEYPSQVNEMWILSPDLLPGYARHVVTGDPLPVAVILALKAAENWGEGFRTTEHLAAVLLDQAWHRIGPDTVIDDVATFERQALQQAGLAHDLIPPRYRSTYFQHIFALGYSAGYYSYIWSEVLDAETVEWFRENGGLDRRNGDLFRRKLLSVGGAVDPLGAFRSVRGRNAQIGPLLRRRGLDRAG